MSERIPTVGENVEIHAFGTWYPGKVVKATKVRLSIEYTSGTGKTRVKAVGVEAKRGEAWVYAGRLWRLPAEVK